MKAINKVRKKILWTKKDDKILSDIMGVNGMNLEKGYVEVKEKLKHRTIIALRNRWYMINKDNNLKTITCGDSTGFSHNKKNLHRNKDGNLPIISKLTIIDLFVMTEKQLLSNKDLEIYIILITSLIKN